MTTSEVRTLNLDITKLGPIGVEWSVATMAGGRKAVRLHWPFVRAGLESSGSSWSSTWVDEAILGQC